MTQILYQDKHVTIYKELLVISKYFFPLGTSKTIMFSDIETIGLHSSQGVNHRWGLSSTYLNNWFPLDSNRKSKTKFIEITLKGRKIKPSFSPEDPDKVFQIIWENQTKEGLEYVERKTEKAGKETQLCQQEMMEREKEMETSQQVLEVKQVEQV